MRPRTQAQLCWFEEYEPGVKRGQGPEACKDKARGAGGGWGSGCVLQTGGVGAGERERGKNPGVLCCSPSHLHSSPCFPPPIGISASGTGHPSPALVKAAGPAAQGPVPTSGAARCRPSIAPLRPPSSTPAAISPLRGPPPRALYRARPRVGGAPPAAHPAPPLGLVPPHRERARWPLAAVGRGRCEREAGRGAGA